MKYLTFELVCAANDWIEQTEEEQKAAEAEFDAASMRYLSELESLQPRLSKPAWEFFRYGYAETGLHDGQLLSANVSDNFDYTPDGTKEFDKNRSKLSARIEFLNREENRHYTFDLRGVSSYKADIFSEEWRAAKSVGDLYLYELTTAENDEMQLGFLFASGASIIATFKKLVFKRRPIKT